MLKGDAYWSTTKRSLGWDFDTRQGTINLPPHRLERLYELLDTLRQPRKRLAKQLWYQLLDELRSMALALPGARGLFSALQDSLKHADKRRVRITQQVRDAAEDFRAIADTLRIRPTRM